jgi:predicted nuclease with TOPRIM domain
MVAQNQLELLESRVSEMIERLKALRLEKAKLSSEMSKQESVFHKMQEERRIIRKRLEKLLGTLNHVEGKD